MSEIFKGLSRSPQRPVTIAGIQQARFPLMSRSGASDIEKEQDAKIFVAINAPGAMAIWNERRECDDEN